MHAGTVAKTGQGKMNNKSRKKEGKIETRRKKILIWQERCCNVASIVAIFGITTLSSLRVDAWRRELELRTGVSPLVQNGCGSRAEPRCRH